jgi:1-acyl-sn-glycerol-3-phosphate acyltransferase
MSLAMSSILFVVAMILLALGWWLIRVCEAANEADWGSTWWNRLDGLNRIFCRKVHRLVADDIPLPENSGALLVSNHVSGLDPLLMIAACRRPIRFMIAREQYERFGLNWLFRGIGCIPVERSGKAEMSLRAALRALEDGEVIALFPHGTFHLPGNEPPKIKRGVARLAQLSGCQVYPLRVEDVSAVGHTVAAVFFPSRARIHSFPPINCHELETAACLEYVANVIETEVECPAEEN